MKRKFEALLTEAETFDVSDLGTPEFKAWKSSLCLALKDFGGKDLTRARTISYLTFAKKMDRKSDFFGTTEKLVRTDQDGFNEDMVLTKRMINDILESESDRDAEEQEPFVGQDDLPLRLFISHSEQDFETIASLIELLNRIGLDKKQIFCSSYPGYGVPIGTNFEDKMKTELTSRTMVLFIISDHFIASSYCIVELGAAWVLGKKQIPLYMPGVSYSSIPLLSKSVGMDITNKYNWNELREEIESYFTLNGDVDNWEVVRNRFIEGIHNNSLS